MFDFLKKKITGFVDKLTKKEEKKVEEIPEEKAERPPAEKPKPVEKPPEKKIEKPIEEKPVPEKKVEPKPEEKPKPEKEAKPKKPPEKPKEEKKIEKPKPVKKIEKPKEILKPEIREEKPVIEKPKQVPEKKVEPKPEEKPKPKPETPKPKTAKPETVHRKPETPEPEAIEAKPAVPEFKPEEKRKPGISLSPFKAIKSLITREVEISDSDVHELLENLELELLEADVELTVAEKIREELQEKLVGAKVRKKELNGFIKSTIRDTLVDLMTSEKAFDLLEYMEKSEKPVKLVFLGLNGTGKCVTGDTIIPLADGKLETIKDIYENAKQNAGQIVNHSDGNCILNPGVEVFSMNTKTLKIEKRKPSHVWKLKTRPKLFKIKLNNGSEITVTPEHPLFTLYKGEIKKIKAEDLKEKYYVAIPKITKVEKQEINLLGRINEDKFFLKIVNIDEFYVFLRNKYGTCLNAHNELKPKQTYITFIADWKRTKKISSSVYHKLKDKFKFKISGFQYGKANDMPLIDTMSKELAEFIGLVLAEGHLDRRFVELTNKDCELIERFCKLSEHLFKIKPTTFVDIRGLTRARISNVTVIKFLEKVFEIPLGSKGTNMKIPDVILQSPDEYVKPFLTAYMEADGHIQKKYRVMEISTSSKKAAEGLIFLFQRLGMPSTFTMKKQKQFTSYRIYINGYEKISRLKSFGFFTKKNLARLKNVNAMDRQFEKSELIPNTGSLVREAREASGFHQSDLSNHLGVVSPLICCYEKRDVSIPRDRLKQMSQYLKNEKLKRIAEAEVCWISVSKIEKVKPNDEWVYDLTVDKDHNFVANNIIVHNTTSIAKVAHLLMQNRYKVVFAAADTFRAAAIEQMEVHASRLDVRLIKRDYGADPTSVGYDAVSYAKAHGIDAVLIDTAGRQDTNINLINELKKMNRVLQPDLKLYIGESIAGASVIEQITTFNEEIGIDGVILTKLDCDPKGGTVLSITKATGIPVIYIGTGQKYEDLERFEPDKIIDRLLT